jgi:hypothetical protein
MAGMTIQGSFAEKRRKNDTHPSKTDPDVKL